MIKVIMLFKRKEGVSPEEFSRYWREVHGPLAAKVLPDLKRYVQNHPLSLSRRPAQFDGAAELWFEDMASWKAAGDFYSGDKGKVLRDDEAKFIDEHGKVYLTVEEKVIKQ